MYRVSTAHLVQPPADYGPCQCSVLYYSGTLVILWYSCLFGVGVQLGGIFPIEVRECVIHGTLTKTSSHHPPKKKTSPPAQQCWRSLSKDPAIKLGTGSRPSARRRRVQFKLQCTRSTGCNRRNSVTAAEQQAQQQLDLTSLTRWHSKPFWPCSGGEVMGERCAARRAPLLLPRPATGLFFFSVCRPRRLPREPPAPRPPRCAPRPV
jgi:hypothetical protein